MGVRRRRQGPGFLARLGLGLYRAAVVVSAIIVAVYLAYRVFVTPPPVQEPDYPDSSEAGAFGQEQNGLRRRDQVWTFLLMGTDDGNGNADTLMVASYDVKQQKVGVVSVPRDTIVDRDWTRYPKINGAYSRGVEQVRKEVSHLLGIPIDYYIKVDIKAFVALVNEVGGVEFDVPVDMNYDDPWQNLSIHYKKGMQHLTGQQALEVVRFRHNNDMSGYSDVGRTQTQQALLTAVAKKVLSWGNVPKVASFVNIFDTYVDTDLEVDDMIYFATQAIYVDLNNDVVTKTLEGRGDATYKGYTWCYELNKDKTMADINALLNPYTTLVTDEMAHIVKADSYAT